jgi:hypothetical protein
MPRVTAPFSETNMDSAARAQRAMARSAAAHEARPKNSRRETAALMRGV